MSSFQMSLIKGSPAFLHYYSPSPNNTPITLLTYRKLTFLVVAAIVSRCVKSQTLTESEAAVKRSGESHRLTCATSGFDFNILLCETGSDRLKDSSRLLMKSQTSTVPQAHPYNIWI